MGTSTILLFINTLRYFSTSVEHRKCSRRRDSLSPEGTAERSAGWSVAEPGEKLGQPSMSPRSGATDAGSSFCHPLRGFPLFWLVYPAFCCASPGATVRPPFRGSLQVKSSIEYVTEFMKRSTKCIPADIRWAAKLHRKNKPLLDLLDMRT
jgi:hypothetical protein